MVMVGMVMVMVMVMMIMIMMVVATAIAIAILVPSPHPHQDGNNSMRNRFEATSYGRKTTPCTRETGSRNQPGSTQTGLSV